MRDLSKTVLVAVGLLWAAPTIAADLSNPDLPTKKEIVAPTLPSTWHFEATLDGFAPNMNVNSGIRNFPTLPVYANFFKLLEHLDGIIPVSAVAYNDNFMVGDLSSGRLGRLNGNSKPGDGSLGGVNADLTINETFATAYGGVRIPTVAPDWSVYGTVGVRVFNVNGSLDLSVPVVGFARIASDGRTWADPVAGLKARHRIDDKWSG